MAAVDQCIATIRHLSQQYYGGDECVVQASIMTEHNDLIPKTCKNDPVAVPSEARTNVSFGTSRSLEMPRAVPYFRLRGFIGSDAALDVWQTPSKSLLSTIADSLTRLATKAWGSSGEETLQLLATDRHIVVDESLSFQPNSDKGDFIHPSSLEQVTRLISFHFLPEYTEHPKHQNLKRRKSLEQPPPDPPEPPPDDIVDEVTFFQDFVAGGMAGCASVVVGHPFDTMKVRVQSSTCSGGLVGTLAEFGGFSSLFRGMAAPLSTAAVVNALVFSGYGVASKTYDQYIPTTDDEDGPEISHDPWQKSMTCGSFGGLVQCFIICPMEHVKCRLQVGTDGYKGPIQAVQSIVKKFGVMALYQGWWTTFFREVPAFGLYFATYDLVKDKVNTFFSKRVAAAGGLPAADVPADPMGMGHSHTWLASAIAGGCAGCFTWAVVYPFDMIKTRVQTAPLTTPRSELKMWTIGSAMVKKHGWRYLYRGFGITMIRAFPVNSTVFPVYEFTLLQLRRWQADQ